MGRIEKICALIDKSETFADVGCDHGYCAEYALKRGLCGKVYISDISAKSLKKAENLLKKYIDDGSCVPVCCDGLEKIDPACRQVLIAGMGGEEIIGILSRGFIPEKFIFQPMKNAERLRGYLLDSGCSIVYDDIFYDGKYYFVIKGNRSGGTPSYSRKELLFGRDSLKNPVVADYARAEAEKRLNYLKSPMSEAARAELKGQYELFYEVARQFGGE